LITFANMVIEIWSDISCPFCYIGKRKLEKALKEFEHNDEVKIEFKSYLLNPQIKINEYSSMNDYLMKTKNWTAEYLHSAHQQVEAMAKEVGLEYHLDQVKVTNTIPAHLLLQLAKKKGKMLELKEALMKAHFTDTLDLNKHEVLVEIAQTCGLDADECKNELETMSLLPNIENDIYEAQQIGVKGVPFFVFDNKYGISGAQPIEVFTRTLKQTYESVLK
jgi:predicted DsbA family dithiol-disulfide isomerase